MPTETKEEKKENIFIRFKKLIQDNIKKYLKFLLHLTPYQNLTYTVFAYTIIGWIVLSLPFMNRGNVHFLDNLFTAASLVSTGGLHTVVFADAYTFAGKLFSLLLIQICGIGYMTMTSFIHLSLSQRVAARHKEILNVEFALPRTLNLKHFLRVIIIFTAVIEFIGAVILAGYFVGVENYGLWNGIWHGAFHSISAFCTAGFSLFPNSLEGFVDSKTINIVISSLSLFGAMGFIVVADIINRVIGKTKELSYTTKIIIGTTIFLIVFGTMVIYGTDPALELTLGASFFQAVSAMTTTGFNTTTVSVLSSSSLLIMILLMSIGASPSGTGGGIKTTAVTAVIAIVYNRLIGSNKVTFFGRELPLYRLYIAVSTFMFYTVILFTSLFLLTYFEDFHFVDLFFETASALGTVGLSTGITEQLTYIGKIIIMLTMLIGRVGVITFGMAILSKEEAELEIQANTCKKEDLAV